MKAKNGKTIRKISVIVALVALICMAFAVSVMANEPNGIKGDTCYTYGDLNEDGDLSESDAIYLLYHSVNSEEYPLEQDGDMDGDNETISGKDALHLLQLLLNPNGFQTEVHAYAEPIWTWTQANGGVIVTAHYKCACGENEQDVPVDAQDIVVKESVNATCTEAGSITYEATAVYDGVEYKATKTYTTVATGHLYDPNLKVCQERACLNPGCSHVEAPVGHELSTQAVEQAVNEAAHQYKEVFTCTVCGTPVDGKHYEKHSYKSTITSEANCQHAGVKTYTCSCGDSYTEEIPANVDAHVWSTSGTTVGTVTTYACTVGGCDVTREVIDASAQTETIVDKDTLASVGEVELKDAAIKLDTDTLGQLSGNVQISAQTTGAEEIPNLDSELAGQIGENPVYNFSMTSGGNQVSEFDGEVTITIPYILRPQDDADCIDVWYIADNGEVEVVEGTYSNGYVTFTTKHFSYYTVTRLTPAQRCEAYGHGTAEKTEVIAPTCENGGYTLHVCVRCSKKWTDNEVAKLGHDYVVDEKEATCTENGYYNADCSRCDSVINRVEIAPGHDCEDTTVEATCETRGYVLHACKNCDYEEIEYDAAETGHDYKATWTWDKTKITATLNLTCRVEDCGHQVDKAATVGVEKQIMATCEDEGYVIYTAQLKYNGVSYSDSYTATEAQLAHKVGNAWQHNSQSHYKVCAWCNTRLEEKDHEFTASKVTKEATCTETGEKTVSCICGYETKESIPVLGHDLDGAHCTRCDFTTINCDHDKTTMVEVNIEEADGCEGWFVYETCECGKFQTLLHYEMYCDFDGEETISKDANGYDVYHIDVECKDCGMQFVADANWEISADCTGNRFMTATITDKTGKVLVDFDGFAAQDVMHPQAVHGETVDLATYGLCGEKITYTECPCGEYESIVIDSTCEWSFDNEASMNGASTFVCEECGATRTVTWDYEEIDACHGFGINHFTYAINGEEIGTFTEGYMDEYHEGTYTFELDGDSCEDGYTVIYECNNCDYSYSHYEKPEAGIHYTYYKEFDLSEYDLCQPIAEGYICPCGECSEISIADACEWMMLDMDEGVTVGNTTTTTVSYECDVCGLKWTSVDVTTKTDDPCITKWEYTCTYKKGNEVIFEEHRYGTGENHDFAIIATALEGDSCEEGGYLTTECKNCGLVRKEEIYGHVPYMRGSYDLAEYGMCGGTLEVYGCACGENQWMETVAEDGEQICDWMHWDYDDETQTSTWKCMECGIYRQDYNRMKDLGDCKAEYINQMDYMNAYDVLLSVKTVSLAENHDYTYEYQLNGEFCWDGYYTIATCQECGTVNRWYNQSEPGEHYYSVEDRHELSEYGFCGGEIWKNACPCGQESGYNLNLYGCDWMWYAYDAENDSTIEKCRNCGSYFATSYEIISNEGCTETFRQSYTFYDADMNEVLSCSFEGQNESHDSTYSFVLDGMTCSDGFLITYTCKDCGYSDSSHFVPSPGEHPTYPMETLDMEELGLCPGEFIYRSCPCGQDSWRDQEGGCDWMWQSGDMDSSTYRCNTCGATRTMTEVRGEAVGCYIPVTATVVIYDADGNEVYRYEELHQYDNHDYEVTGHLMHGESCTDGYEEYRICKNCGFDTIYYGDEHEASIFSEYDLTSYNVCAGTEVYSYTCYCGKNQNLHTSGCDMSGNYNEYVDEMGVRHEVMINDCMNCDLMITDHKTYDSIDPTTCLADVTYRYTITVGEHAIGVYEFVTKLQYHDMVETIVLKDGATSCEEGTYVTNTCKNCDYGYTYEDYNHRVIEVAGEDSRIDLSQYGSTCGGYFVHKACICGQNDGYQWETECDLSNNTIEPWLGQEYDDQKTTSGWIYATRFAYEIRCAVTSPDCDLNVRECRYYVWNKDNCEMQEVYVWQFGYDAQTGTCQKEVSIVADTFAYHDYESSSSEVENAVGGVDRSISEICKTCNSSRVVRYAYDADNNQYLSEETCINTLDNGEPSYTSSVYEDVFQYGVAFDLRDYDLVRYADGTESWNCTEYTYDWDNFDCTRLYTYTNSDGDCEEYEQECHAGYSEYVQDVEPGCTQFGEHHYEIDCQACGETVIESTHTTSPAGHDYVWTDSFYTCSRCGLESENGADGTIILEDMTDAYGAGENYVIGYFNRSGYQFNYYVGVVTADNEVVLSDITFTVLTKSADGINAISFSKAEVAVAMEAAGVTSGDVRLTFVPADAGFDLDYSITLTK